ncbi:MAG TPA: RNA polymerase sigma factor [Coriobacteriia bacterium]|nr:RNA polymerase sigma factor [Coriobacteriia bacterium]
MVDDMRFERVYAAHGPAVLRYCAYSLGSRDRAEDVAAEVFARYLERGDRLDDERVEGWLIRVARNLCASQHRSITRDRKLAEAASRQMPSADTWSDPDWWELVREELGEAERLVVYLRAVEDRPFSDIARVTGKGQSAVKMTFYRAAEKLRSRYEREFATLRSAVPGGVGSEQ